MLDIEGLRRSIEANPERETVLNWIIAEWDRYSNPKWGFGKDSTHMQHTHEAPWMRDQGFKNDSDWARQIFQYLDRATVFGVGEPGTEAPERGKQAAMKMATTLIDALAVMIRVFGLPPAPGAPSGVIEEWVQSPKNAEGFDPR